MHPEAVVRAEYLVTHGYYSLNLVSLLKSEVNRLNERFGKCMQVSLLQLDDCQHPEDSFFTSQDIFALLFYITLPSFLISWNSLGVRFYQAESCYNDSKTKLPLNGEERSRRKDGESRMNSHTLRELITGVGVNTGAQKC